MPRILECIEHVIGPGYKLSSLNARSTNPHNGEAQPWHADAGAIVDERGYWVCNSVWMLDDFTAENGATRMVPRSHTWRRLPEPGNAGSLPGEALVTGKAGTVVIMNAHMWHGGTANRTDRCRRALHGVLHARRQAAAAVSEGVAAPGDHRRSHAAAASRARHRRRGERPAQRGNDAHERVPEVKPASRDRARHARVANNTIRISTAGPARSSIR